MKGREWESGGSGRAEGVGERDEGKSSSAGPAGARHSVAPARPWRCPLPHAAVLFQPAARCHDLDPHSPFAHRLAHRESSSRSFLLLGGFRGASSDLQVRLRFVR